MSRPKRQVELEKICQMMGKAIQEEMNDLTSGPPLGFMLYVFDFGEGGFNAYMSNAKREDMIKLLREHADYLENM